MPELTHADSGVIILAGAALVAGSLKPFRLPQIRRAGCPIERQVNAALKHPERLREHPHFEHAAAEIDGGKHNPDCRDCLDAFGLDDEQQAAVLAFHLSDATLRRIQRQVLTAARRAERTTAERLLGVTVIELLRERTA